MGVRKNLLDSIKVERNRLHMEGSYGAPYMDERMLQKYLEGLRKE